MPRLLGDQRGSLPQYSIVEEAHKVLHSSPDSETWWRLAVPDHMFVVSWSAWESGLGPQGALEDSLDPRQVSMVVWLTRKNEPSVANSASHFARAMAAAEMHTSPDVESGHVGVVAEAAHSPQACSHCI